MVISKRIKQISKGDAECEVTKALVPFLLEDGLIAAVTTFMHVTCQSGYSTVMVIPEASR